MAELTAALDRCCSVVCRHLVELLAHPCATHVLRSLFLVLGGFVPRQTEGASRGSARRDSEAVLPSEHVLGSAAAVSGKPFGPAARLRPMAALLAGGSAAAGDASASGAGSIDLDDLLDPADRRAEHTSKSTTHYIFNFFAKFQHRL